MDLTKKKCVPCEGGVEPMSEKEAKKYLEKVPNWNLVGNKISRKLKFKDFKEAIKFVNKVAGIAEKEQHHPDINISYNKVELGLTTHAINGLSENDFIVAAKINKLL